MHTVVVINHRDRGVARSVRDLQRAAYVVEAKLIGYDRMPPLVEEIDDVVRLPLMMLGVREDSRMLGVLGYGRVHDVVDIDRLAVDPSRFRTGIGRALLASVHEREVDAARFDVSTGAENAPAIALYRSSGYRQIREEQRSGVTVVRLTRFAAGRC